MRRNSLKPPWRESSPFCCWLAHRSSFGCWTQSPYSVWLELESNAFGSSDRKVCIQRDLIPVHHGPSAHAHASLNDEQYRPDDEHEAHRRLGSTGGRNGRHIGNSSRRGDQWCREHCCRKLGGSVRRRCEDCRSRGGKQCRRRGGDPGRRNSRLGTGECCGRADGELRTCIVARREPGVIRRARHGFRGLETSYHHAIFA